MKPLPANDIPKLEKLMAAMIAEGNLQERSSVEHCKVKLLEGYGYRNMDTYVDDLSDPKRVIIFGRMNGIVTKEKINSILWIYAVPELRNKETREMFKSQIEAYENFHPCDAWIASDWQWQGADTGAGAFLRWLGFVPQELVYAKLTTK